VSGETLQQKVLITSPHGFHMRPAATFAALASRFQSNVTVSHAGKRANGKSTLDLLLLVAEQGAELTVEVSGPDAREALAALVALLEQGPEFDPDPP